jgi:hypothetical protein
MYQYDPLAWLAKLNCMAFIKHKLFYLSILPIFTSFWVVNSLATTPLQCARLLDVHPKPQSTSENTLQDALNFRKAIAKNSANPRLTSVAKRYGISQKSSAERDYSESELDDLLKHHVDFLQRFRDPQIFTRLENEALTRSLKAHGLKINPRKTARENLAEQSLLNLKRVLHEKKLSSEYLQDPVIASTLHKIHLRASHNTQTTKFEGGALFSSRQIQEYGYAGGLNSLLPFTRQFMRQDDNVFFIISWSNKTAPNQYGQHTITIDHDYTMAHGWVSPFIMTESDLASFGSSFLRNKYKDRDLDTEISDAAIEREENHRTHFRPLPTEVELRNQLYLFDFTFRDYEHLAKTYIGNVLLYLKRNPNQTRFNITYEDAISSLMTDHPIDSSIVISQLLNPLWNYGRVELKFPVAISTEHIKPF